MNIVLFFGWPFVCAFVSCEKAYLSDFFNVWIRTLIQFVVWKLQWKWPTRLNTAFGLGIWCIFNLHILPKNILRRSRLNFICNYPPKASISISNPFVK